MNVSHSSRSDVVRDRRWWPLVAVVVAAVGCGGGGDTGYGANEPVPATPNCQDQCQRSADCLVNLCDEDENTTTFEAGEASLVSGCLSECNDAELQSAASPQEWACFFQKSCREVFQDDACNLQASYTCTTSGTGGAGGTTGGTGGTTGKGGPGPGVPDAGTGAGKDGGSGKLALGQACTVNSDCSSGNCAQLAANISPVCLPAGAS